MPEAPGGWRHALDVALCCVFAADYVYRLTVRRMGRMPAGPLHAGSAHAHERGTRSLVGCMRRFCGSVPAASGPKLTWGPCLPQAPGRGPPPDSAATPAARPRPAAAAATPSPPPSTP